MSVDPLACTLLAAASLSASMRRALGRAEKPEHDHPIDPLGTAVAAARHRARLLHIPDSAVSAHVLAARARGQSELSALNDLIAGADPRCKLR